MLSEKIDLPDADITYYRNFLSAREADRFLEILLKDLNWQQHHIKIFGKTIPQPRLTALYAVNDQSYAYSHLTLNPGKFTPELQELHDKLQRYLKVKFTHVLGNLYRNGNDSMGWHADNEKELGKEPVIASVSLGVKRKFQLKHKDQKDLKYQLDLEHGSLLLMKGKTQHFWKHQLPKTTKPIGQRINLTFRILV